MKGREGRGRKEKDRRRKERRGGGKRGRRDKTRFFKVNILHEFFSINSDIKPK